MKAVVQRVTDASVTVAGTVVGHIAAGLLVYLGVANGDTEADARWLADKIVNLRIFDDPDGKMNLSIKDLSAADKADTKNPPGVLYPRGVLAISQFTLLGDARKGRRPSWNNAAPPETAEPLYGYCVAQIRAQGLPCETGVFQTHMAVTYTNDGPVTILLDSRE
ncbi:D-aminoacyl-tRNA deacylase [Spirochaetia bacterium]|nr:D-aminoacyl-tRNA deacylase [Spirochaetia bacterium]